MRETKVLAIMSTNSRESFSLEGDTDSNVETDQMNPGFDKQVNGSTRYLGDAKWSRHSRAVRRQVFFWIVGRAWTRKDRSLKGARNARMVCLWGQLITSTKSNVMGIAWAMQQFGIVKHASKNWYFPLQIIWVDRICTLELKTLVISLTITWDAIKNLLAENMLISEEIVVVIVC